MRGWKNRLKSRIVEIYHTNITVFVTNVLTKLIISGLLIYGPLQGGAETKCKHNKETMIKSYNQNNEIGEVKLKQEVKYWMDNTKFVG